MQENQFLLFLNHLRLPYSIPKSFALLLAFHCFRHTFATLQIAAGTDIYTVSKMLTHRNVSTTQIYAELVNEKKRESANRISLK
jgi:site-specific recombinase XerD